MGRHQARISNDGHEDFHLAIVSRGAIDRLIQRILAEFEQANMSRIKKKRRSVGISSHRGLVALLIALVGWATPSAAEDAVVLDPDSVAFDDILSDEWDDVPTGYPDAFENSNRSVFAFNRRVDQWVLDPMTKGYRYAVPKPVRVAFSRVFINLGSTKTLVNDLLQLEWADASVTVTRLLLNSSVGIGGLFDVATKLGIEGHESDFGQTLALAAVPSGPYLVLPVLGPATIRDGLGTVIDGFFQPTYYIIGPANLLIGPTEILLYSGTSGISTRDRHFLELKALEASSVDFYSALRNGYYQQRIDEIWGNRDGHRTTEETGLK
jgi:phospholipid-binding lipoprotein MlaA